MSHLNIQIFSLPGFKLFISEKSCQQTCAEKNDENDRRKIEHKMKRTVSSSKLKWNWFSILLSQGERLLLKRGYFVFDEIS